MKRRTIEGMDRGSIRYMKGMVVLTVRRYEFVEEGKKIKTVRNAVAAVMNSRRARPGPAPESGAGPSV